MKTRGDQIAIVQSATDRTAALSEASQLLDEIRKGEALMEHGERILMDRRFRLGRVLAGVRKGYPPTGRKAAGWGEFCEELGISRDTAQRYIETAEQVAVRPELAERRSWLEVYEALGLAAPGWDRFNSPQHAAANSAAPQQSASLPAPPASEQAPTQETPLPPYTGESGRHLLYPEEAPAQALSSKPLRAAGGEDATEADASEADDRHDTRSATVPPARGAATPGDRPAGEARDRGHPVAGGGADPGSGGSDAPLSEIASALGCEAALPEILAAIESLKVAAAQPGDGAAEWSALVESAQAWQARAERAEAALSQVQEEESDNTTLRTVPLPASEPTSDELGELRPGDPLVIKGGRRCLFAAFRRGSTQVIAVWCRPTTKWPRGAWDTVPLSKISRDPEPVDRVADLRALLAAGPAERFQGEIERALAEAEGAVAVEQEPRDGGKKRRR